MAKPKRRKATLHSAGKVTEQELLEHARELYDDPSPVIPICEPPCGFFSPVRAAQKAMRRIHAARDDDTALARYANRGNELARAFAATLLLGKQEKIPFVADLRLPGEKVPYVMRGKAKPFFLAGVQHHDDRALRLLAVASWARKRGLHFYSADRGIVCTGKRPAPPRDFLEEEARLLGLGPRDGGVFACGHEGDLVALRWTGSDVVFERCGDCGKDGSMVAQARKHVAVPRVERQFDVEPRLAPLEGARADVATTLPPQTLKDYFGGKLSDAQLLEAAHKARVVALRGGGRQYVAGGVSYGDDADAFVRALDAGPDEARALHAALAAHDGPVVLERATLARAVHQLWDEHGLIMLEAVADADVARGLHKEGVAPDEALGLVRKAAKQGKGRAALAGVPAYASLPPAAAAADAVARAFRAQGRDAAVRVAQERANVGAAKGVALAMLTALQARAGQEWRFSTSDQEVAATLAPHAEALLRGPPESYHDALVAASRGAGETGEIRQA